MATVSGDLSTGLVAYWKLDEASGTREDIHSTYDLTANGTGGVGSATGKIGDYAADFEAGDSDYLSRTDALGIASTDQFSISMWVKMESTGTTQQTPFSFNVNNGTTDQQIYADIGVAGSNVIRLIDAPGNAASYTWSGIDTTNWHHLVFTYKPSTSSNGLKIYIDGTNVASATSGGTVNAVTASTFTLGASVFGGGYPPFGRYFDGLIDEVGVWNTELTSGNVTTLYNSGDGIPYASAGATVNSGFFNFM
jgi:hypothetical protein